MSWLIEIVFLITSDCFPWVSPIVLIVSEYVFNNVVISCILWNTFSKYSFCVLSLTKFSFTCPVISLTFCCTFSITDWTTCNDSCVLFARFPTSVATTANPFPASPALAASIEAFNASKFVESEISLIRPRVTPISCTASDNLCVISVVAFIDSDTSALIVCKLLRSFSFLTDLSNKSLETCSTFSTLSVTTASHLLSSPRFAILSSVLKLSMLLLSTNCSLVAANSSAEALSFSDICESDNPAVRKLSDNVCTVERTLVICSLFFSNSSFFTFTKKCATKNTKIINPVKESESATRHIIISERNNSSLTGRRSVPRINQPVNSDAIQARPLINNSLISRKNAIKIRKKNKNPQNVLVGSIYNR